MSLQNLVIGLVALVALAVGGVAYMNGEKLGAAAGTDHYNTENFINGILFRDDTLVVAADRTLSPLESGKKIYIGTAGVDLTLPVPQKGLNYQVFVSANFATTNMTITGPAADASDDVMYGTLEVVGAAVLCSAEDTISFVNTAELPGDFVLLRSDGTNWYITGQGGTSGAITCTDAD